jgi:hypothetical protein
MNHSGTNLIGPALTARGFFMSADYHESQRALERDASGSDLEIPSLAIPPHSFLCHLVNVFSAKRRTLSSLRISPFCLVPSNWVVKW